MCCANLSLSQKPGKIKIHSLQSDLMVNSNKDHTSCVSQTFGINVSYRNTLFGVGYSYSRFYIHSVNKDKGFELDSSIFTRSGFLVNIQKRTPLAKSKWYGLLESQLYITHLAAENKSPVYPANVLSHIKVDNIAQLTLGYGIGVEFGRHVILQTSVQTGYGRVKEIHYPVFTTWQMRLYDNSGMMKCFKLSLIYKL